MNIRNNLREFKEFGGFVLDDFQAEALAYFVAAFLGNLPGGLGVLPTGAGKTVIAACFIDLARQSLFVESTLFASTNCVSPMFY